MQPLQNKIQTARDNLVGHVQHKVSATPVAFSARGAETSRAQTSDFVVTHLASTNTTNKTKPAVAMIGNSSKGVAATQVVPVSTDYSNDHYGKWNHINPKMIFKEFKTPWAQTKASFQAHADECSTCHFNYKNAAGLLIATTLDVKRIAYASIAAGTLAHFTPRITGDNAAQKCGMAVGAADLMFKGVEKAFKIQRNPYVEIPVTLACICAADWAIKHERQLEAWAYFFH